MYWWMILAGTLLNVALGAADWHGVLAGSLNDPDSYMRLLRIEQGIQSGHLLTNVTRDGSGAGVYVEWSRLLDALIWAACLPLAPFLGWHRALFVAGVALGPLASGALGAALAWAAEPFVARRYLWMAVIAAGLLPGLLTFAVLGVVHYHVWLLVLIVTTIAAVARAAQGDNGYGFLAGLSGGFAIWLTPETMPFVLMAFAALVLVWWRAPIALTLVCCAAGFVDVLGFGLTVDPPFGGYGVPAIDRLSLVYVVLGLLLLLGTGGLWRLERRGEAYARPLGLAIMALAVLGWVAVFPRVAMGPYGLMSPEDMRRFFGVMSELQPVQGREIFIFLLPGALALAYALWRAKRGPAHIMWLYVSACAAVALVLGLKFILFVGFSATLAAGLVPFAVAEVSQGFAARAARASLARIGVLLTVIGLPWGVAFALPPPAAPAGAKGAPACGLREIGTLLAPAGHSVVLAPVEDTPEILYRSEVDTVGSLYQHGVPAYLRAREAWRVAPSDTVPDAVRAAKAQYVLFCPQNARYGLVQDVAGQTLWDELQAGTAPPWLSLAGTNVDGWRLYKISP